MGYTLRRLIGGLSALLLCFVMLPFGAAADAVRETGAPDSSAAAGQAAGESLYDSSQPTYAQYIAQYDAAPEGSEVIPIELERYTAGDGEFSLGTLSTGEKALFSPAAGWVRFPFSVSADGLYRLRVSYCPLEGSGSAAVRSFAVDGEEPYYEATVVELPRVWGDQVMEPAVDDLGNDILPMQTETPRPETVCCKSSTGRSDETLLFYLTKGEHTLTVSGEREPVALLALQWEPPAALLSYRQTAEEYARRGYQPVGQVKRLQAEETSAKSDATMYPLNDKTSPNTEPASDWYVRYNTIGGSKWQKAGQWLEWSFTVPESGLYTIALRYKQNVKANSTVYRRLMIDGSVPFAEAEALAFPYASRFTACVLGDAENGDYQFYLTAGTVHTLRLEAVTGVFADVLETGQQLVNDLNAVYREILMITGPSPDLYRDYSFAALIPGTLAEMTDLIGRLEALADEVRRVTGWEDGSELSSIQMVIRTLQRMTEDETTIAARFSNFRDNITALASWVLNTAVQPLELDYFVIGGQKTDIAGHGGFFENLRYQLLQFAGSFVMDYNSLGQVGGEQQKSVTVWLQTGRDQSQIIRSLINQDFTPSSGVGVRLQLVAAGSLLPAVIAGMGPDVALQLGQGEPMNYAFRHTAADLSAMPGIGEIRARFDEQALVPFSYGERLYALPESQSFQMLFYRKDILAELGITAGDLDTWESIRKVVVPELQKNYLDFGLLPTLTNFSMLLYQSGGALYSADGRQTLLSEDVSVSTFDSFTKLYTEYLQPVAFVFANRFRTGEMPLAVMDFTAYNQLSVFAPEISGLWGMLPVPGTAGADGTVDRTAVLSVSACVLFEYSEHKEDAWTFMTWWTSADVQNKYGKNMESIMGTAARYSSANKEAFASVSWTGQIRRAINAQQAHLRAIPEVPGGYYTSRYFDFAYRDIVNDNKEVRPTLNEVVLQINSEIADKREEFGLD